MRLKGLLPKKAEEIKSIFPEVEILPTEDISGTLQDVYIPERARILVRFNQALELLSLYSIDNETNCAMIKEEEFVEFVIN